MSLAFLFPDLMLNMFRMLIVLQPASGYHTTPAEPYRNTTHIVPEQYNPRNNSTNKSQAPEDGCINIL